MNYFTQSEHEMMVTIDSLEEAYEDIYKTERERRNK